MLTRMASAIGIGMVAGAIGTAAMTASSTAEMKLRGRGGSNTPAEALCRLLGVEALGEQEKARVTNVVHWAYGTGLGALRGLIATAGLKGPKAAMAFFATVWGGELVMLPALDVAPPATQWDAATLATDAAHHLVYALATSVAYAALEQG
jgi:hypothetical protein